MKCYLIDDRPGSFKKLKEYIQQTEGLTLVGTSTDPYKALEYLNAQTADVDLIFMDIEMPGIRGLELAKLLDPKFKVIFVTAHNIYGQEAFIANAVFYLQKPVKYEHFLLAINKVTATPSVNYSKNDHNLKAGINTILIRGESKGAWEKIRYTEITHVTADGNYLHIYTTNNRRRTVYSSLQKFAQQCKNPLFIQVHRSTIINMDHIIKGDTEQIFLAGNVEINIGPAFKEALFERLFGSSNSLL
ncbi:LytR/AlgR family response regulator transcription factor [Sphingobacterium multivorum]|uniref:LytR/AlgR family response regulator transcription factor n=1 Tax=Sphingobacterium multivorum TaxID=28454 RepID=UPI0028AA70E7|nr:LytTR family DNA-binding domain-containing protein [Sphingobacterium multivorum]